METFYVLIISPMDQTAVGPFQTKLAAETNACLVQSLHGFNAYTLTENEMLDNMAQFGDIPIQTP